MAIRAAHKGREVSDYDLLFMGESSKAICVSSDGGEPSFWLPKSQIEYTLIRQPNVRDVVKVTIPNWLAEERGLA